MPSGCRRYGTKNRTVRLFGATAVPPSGLISRGQIVAQESDTTPRIRRQGVPYLIRR
ncbi:Uncharacterised protein [Mycobacteroides abscessus subsp. abscessus]|nr:Uncharacterised protein [Mycobacteroides abscessus subsp. abscessus]